MVRFWFKGLVFHVSKRVSSTFGACQLHEISHLVPVDQTTSLKNIILVLRLSKFDDASSKTIKDI